MFGVKPLETFELTAPEEGANQSWIQVAKVGSFVHMEQGKVEITPVMLNEMVENAKQFNAAPIDYDHLSLKPKKDRRPEDCEAAGWTTDQYELRDSGNTLWAMIDWTLEAAQKIRAKKFRYFSPTYAKNYFSHDNGKPIGARLLGGGLTNYPFLQGMAEVMLRAPQITLTERQERVSQAFYEKYNANLDSNIHISEWVDEDALLARKDGKLIKVPFALDDKLNVSFGESKEVVRILKELSQESVIMPNDNSTPPVLDLSTNTQFMELSQNYAALATQVTTLSGNLTTTQAALNESKKELAKERATNKVKNLIRAGKLAKKQEEWAVDYCLSATPEQVVKWEDSLDKIVRLNTEDGSSESDDVETTTKTDGIAAFQTAINTAMETKKLSYEAAIKVVSAEQPDLFDAYRRSFNDFAGDGRTM